MRLQAASRSAFVTPRTWSNRATALRTWRASVIGSLRFLVKAKRSAGSLFFWRVLSAFRFFVAIHASRIGNAYAGCDYAHRYGPRNPRYRLCMDAGITPPQILPPSVDRRVFEAIHGLPHSPRSDRYISVVSDLGEGMGCVAAGIGADSLGGQKGRRAGIATALASLGTTYVVQRMVKPIFRRRRPFVAREVMVVGIRTADASFPPGHTASSFAAATGLGPFSPKAGPPGVPPPPLSGAAPVPPLPPSPTRRPTRARTAAGAR